MTSPSDVPEWEEKFNTQLSLWKEIRESENLLRFDTRYIKISDIASQYYCEKKVELAYIHGDVDTEDKLMGREGHEELTEDYVELTLREGWEQIFTVPHLVISEFLFLAKYKDIYFAFQPDRIFFENGVPKLLVEFKFSKYRRPFISHHVQLQAEGLLFEKLGFDVSSLYYIIIIAPKDLERDSTYLNDIPKRIFEKIRPHLTEEHYIFRNVNAYFYKFDLEKAKTNLKWALEYWRQNRDAQLTDNKNKCRSCEYRDSCDF